MANDSNQKRKSENKKLHEHWKDDNNYAYDSHWKRTFEKRNILILKTKRNNVKLKHL